MFRLMTMSTAQCSRSTQSWRGNSWQYSHWTSSCKYSTLCHSDSKLLSDLVPLCTQRMFFSIMSYCKYSPVLDKARFGRQLGTASQLQATWNLQMVMNRIYHKPYIIRSNCIGRSKLNNYPTRDTVQLSLVVSSLCSPVTGCRIMSCK